MTTQVRSPYDWIREIQPILKDLDAIPLTGSAPPFPWEELSLRISQSFDRPGISIEPGELTWRTKEQLFEGLGDAPFPIVFAIPTLRGQVDWVMPEQEIALLEAILLTKETHPLSFQDISLRESFYRFFALEVLYNLSQISFDKSIAPILSKQPAQEPQDALCFDILLKYKEHVIVGRLIISPDLRQSWVDHYANKGPSKLFQDLAESVFITAHLEAGHAQMNLKEWQTVEEGDFILLDSCSLDPEHLTNGRVIITINGRQAFRAKLKDHQVKILELPLYQEVHAHMAKEKDQNHHFDDEEPTETEETSEFDSSDEEWLANDSEELEFESESTESEQNEVEPEIETAQPRKEISKPGKKSEEQNSGPITADKISIHLTVEVGRIKMTVDRLLKLEPGNLLELEVHPEDGVDLTVNGDSVGKGELVKIGDLLGVRVLQLGRQIH